MSARVTAAGYDPDTIKSRELPLRWGAQSDIDAGGGTESLIGDDLTLPNGDSVPVNGVGTVLIADPPQGWRCPGCQQCFSPMTPKCDTCGASQTQYNTSGGSTHWVQCEKHNVYFAPGGYCGVCAGEVTGSL